MKKLKFKLLSNNKEKINETTNCFIKDNIINFKIDNDIYYYNKEDIILTKKNKEKEIIMKFKEKVIIINLLSNNIKVDYPIEKSSIDIRDNKVIINYTLESDKTIENTIYIEI